ncbi:hypothetical protein ACJX0J_014376, partial [Zea mays]
FLSYYFACIIVSTLSTTVPVFWIKGSIAVCFRKLVHVKKHLLSLLSSRIPVGGLYMFLYMFFFLMENSLSILAVKVNLYRSSFPAIGKCGFLNIAQAHILSLFIVCLKYTGVQLFKSDKQVADNKCHMLLQLIMEQAYLAQIYNGLFDLEFPNKIYVIIGGADLHSAFKKYLIGTKFSWEAQIYSGFSAFKKNLIGTKFDLGFSWKVFIIILRQHRLNLNLTG